MNTRLKWQCVKNTSLQILKRDSCDLKIQLKPEDRGILTKDCEGCSGPEWIGDGDMKTDDHMINLPKKNNKSVDLLLKQEIEKSSFIEETVEILIQLQWKRTEAKKAIKCTLAKNPEIKTVEKLIKKIFKKDKSEKNTKYPKSFTSKPTDYKNRLTCKICGKLLKDENRTGLCRDHYNESRRRGEAEPLVIKIDFGEYPETDQLIKRIKQEAIDNFRPINSQIMFIISEYFKK